MNPNTRLHPEKWTSFACKTEIPKNETDIIKDTDEIRGILAAEVTNPITNKRIFSTILVIERENILIGKQIVSDSTGIDCLQKDFVVYPKEDLEPLLNEVKEKTLAFIKDLIEGDQKVAIVDTTKPVVGLFIKELKNTRQYIQKTFSSNPEPLAQEIIDTVLKQLKITEIKEEFQIAPIMPVSEEDKKLNNLQRALKEQELIKKFGKKRIEDLAKKINYYGEIVNKIK